MSARTVLAAVLLLFSVPLAPSQSVETPVANNPGKLRASAEEAFANGDIDKAIRLLSQTISIEPDNDKNYYKRYRAYLRSKKYREALEDLSSAIKLDPNDKTKLLQRTKLLRMMGRCSDAVNDYIQLERLAPGGVFEGREEAHNCAASIQLGDHFISQSKWHEAREYISRAVQVTEHAPDLLFKKGQCNYMLEDYYDAAADTGRAIKMDPTSIPALELRALAYYQIGEYDVAMTHFREALKYDPEHKGCKTNYRRLKNMQKNVEKGDKALEQGKLADALGYYRKAIEADPHHKVFNSGVLVKMARCYMKSKEYLEAKDASVQAIELNERMMEAYLTLADAVTELDDLEEAVRVLKTAQERFKGDGTVEEALKKAEVALKQSNEINYYQVLGIARNAGTSEIKKAYRALAKKYHPDKLDASVSPEGKEKAEKEFLKVTEAYEVLSNDDLRQRYDRGEDVMKRGPDGQPQGNPFGGFGGFHGFQQGGGGPTFTFQFR